MPRPNILYVLVLFVAVAGQPIAGAHQQFAERSRTEKAKPRDFPDLPKHVRKALEKRPCLVPQVDSLPSPHNVISGEFSRTGQKDWVALCSSNGRLHVVVLWQRHSPCPEVVTEMKEENALQAMEGGVLAFSLTIVRAEPAYIEQKQREYEPARTLKPSHDGIEITFVGKASTIAYCNGKDWVMLQGAD